MNESIEPVFPKTYSGPIIKDTGRSDWTCLVLTDSNTFFGTGKTVKVICLINGSEFPVTLMPFGNGNQMLPLKAAILTQIDKKIGDTIEVTIVGKQ